MEPSFRVIADLFKVPTGEQLDIRTERRRKAGRDADESDELGRQSLLDGDYEAAIKHFRAAVAQRADGDIKSMINLAGAYEYSDQAPQALREYEKALRAKDDAEPHVGKADLYRRYGRFRDSIVELEEAIAREPGNPYYHMKLAMAFREAGEPSKAYGIAQRAIVIQPDESFYHYWIGDLLIHLKRFEEALDSMRAAIELSPGDDFLYLRASVAFWRADRKPEAVKAIRLASDLDPEKHLYHGLLGILLQEMGLDEEAALESDRAAKMDRYDHDQLSRLLDELDIEP